MFTVRVAAYVHLLALFVSCAGYAEFEQFPGFDGLAAPIDSTIGTPQLTTDYRTLHRVYNYTEKRNLETSTELQNTTGTTSSTNKPMTRKKGTFKCIEEETPKNIGPYEVPSQRDLVLLTNNILMESFDIYNQRSMQLLKDIKAATRAAVNTEAQCRFNKNLYKECVKIVSKQCEQYTKDSLINLEAQKLDVLAITEDKICKLWDMKTDPLQLIKFIAQEKSILDFALPSFLMLINNCNTHCTRSNANPIKIPMRHMTDQDLVVRHFLTKKNYIQLIKDSKHKV